MRRKIVAGNWKMNKAFAEAISLVNTLSNQDFDSSVQMIVIPPSLFAAEAVNRTDGTNLEVGVQNCSEHENGAYTGEISAKMIASIGATHCLVGHSERRQYFNEQNLMLAKKIDRLLLNKITPIYCCGEHLPEREANTHFDVVKTQSQEGLFHLSSNDFLNCVIAYEPVWAIGTGVTASAEQAQEMHHYIRGLVTEKYGEEIAQSTNILYGGSCNPENAKELFANPDVDGGLIGGASLDADKFVAIANSF